MHAQSCLTFCDPMDYSKPDSSVHGIFQARILEWKLPFPPPRNLSHPGMEPESPALAGRFFTTVSSGKLRQYHYYWANEQTGVQEDLESCRERFYGLLCTTGSGARVQAQVCFKGPQCADCATSCPSGAVPSPAGLRLPLELLVGVGRESESRASSRVKGQIMKKSQLIYKLKLNKAPWK